MMAESEPIDQNQAMKNSNWLAAMHEELISRSNKKPIDVKQVYKLKLRPNGEIAMYKARLVARGFLQKLGIEFNEVYAPVARLETIRVVVAIATYKGWKMHQLDIKSTFFNGLLNKETYVQQPPSFKIKGQEMKVCILRKALNGTSSQSFEQKDKWFSDRDSFHKMYFRVWCVCQRLKQTQLDYHMLICT